ncbi:MAG: hypothetical protein K2X44_07105, partial [Magnetospirillum sp.]|nr:hypothetical protein [Magnetospirillum sp.]
RLQSRLRVGDRITDAADHVTLAISAQLATRGGAMRAVGPGGQNAIDRADIDPALSTALIRAEAWKKKLLSGEAATVEDIAQTEGLKAAYVARVIRTAFLAPDLKAAILDGRQPAGLTLQGVMTRGVPLDWVEQRATFRA